MVNPESQVLMVFELFKPIPFLQFLYHANP